MVVSLRKIGAVFQIETFFTPKITNKMSSRIFFVHMIRHLECIAICTTEVYRPECLRVYFLETNITQVISKLAVDEAGDRYLKRSSSCYDVESVRRSIVERAIALDTLADEESVVETKEDESSIYIFCYF